MAFNASTIKPLNKWLRLGLSPVANITGGGLQVNIKQPARTQRVLHSDGAEVWFWNTVANSGIPNRVFGTEEPGRWLELYSAGEAADVTALDTRGSALTSLNSEDYGTFNFSAFPHISVAVIYGAPIWKVMGNFNGGTPLFRSSVPGPQDFSGMTSMTKLEVPASMATSLVLPPVAGNPLLHSIILNHVRLANQDVALPAYAALATLDMASGGGNIMGLVNTFDIAAVPTLSVLNLFAVGCKNLIWSAANAAALTWLEVGGCRFSTRSELGGNLYGNDVDPGLRTLVREAVHLRRLGLTYNSFSATEQAALITAIHGNRSGRPTTTSKTLALAGQDNNYPYPSLHSHLDGNDAVVDSGSRAKLADLLRDNWFISYNAPRATMSYNATSGPTRVRLTFATEQNIQIWSAGDAVVPGDTVVLTLTSSATMVPNGLYRIATSSPGGKVWDIEALPDRPALAITSSVNGQRASLDAPVSFRFRVGSAAYTDTAGSMWPVVVHNGTVLISAQPVARTQETALYRSMATGPAPAPPAAPVPLTLTLPGLLDGDYRARLHFYEGTHTTINQRVFSVAVNGATVLPDLDLWNAAGYQTAWQVEVRVTVSGNQAVIALTPSVGQPVISAVELIRVYDL